jgi:hypothetical protein
MGVVGTSADMEKEHPRVSFTLFCLGNPDTKKLLSPEGSMVFQYTGFPRDVEDCTCVPIGPVGVWSRTDVTDLDAQWYKPSLPIQRSDIPLDVTNAPKVKDYLCHARRPDLNTYVLSSLSVDSVEVQLAAFVGKRLIFRRLGQRVELNLEEVSEDQRFTLSLEWSYSYIEARVTWVAIIDHTGNSPVAEVRQYKQRTHFTATLIPAAIARAIWSDLKHTIEDASPSGEPFGQVESARKAYQNEADLLSTIINIIKEIRRLLAKSRPDAFWNGQQPKSEPDSGSTLRVLFESICAYKNIRVFQEDPSRSGALDFVFTGISMSFDHLEVALEIKNAHSNRLKRGLTHQLPKYMEERQIKQGIYCVLWFKGTNFSKPAGSIRECSACLQVIKPEIVSSVEFLDVSFPIQASQL